MDDWQNNQQEHDNLCKKRQMDKDKSLLGATEIVFVFMSWHLGSLLFYCIVVTFWSSLLLGQTWNLDHHL